MTAPTELTVPQLSRLIGTMRCPVLIDVRIDEDYDQAPVLLPTSRRMDYKTVADWAGSLTGQSVVVICQKGRKLSHGVAAWLRQSGCAAEVLEGGFEAWQKAGEPVFNPLRINHRDSEGRSLWVTRSRPKIDRIACPWLIRRFIDPSARFLFVPPADVLAVAERFEAIPFDVEGVFWSHRGETCTFDTMIEEFGLASAPLETLARIVRGADTARPDLAPQAEGLLAVSLGLSRLYRDDLDQLDAAMILYDALYRWARDAQSETHDWPAKT